MIFCEYATPTIIAVNVRHTKHKSLFCSTIGSIFFSRSVLKSIMAAPRAEDVQAVLQRSQRRWQSDAHYAELHRGFSEHITNPCNLIQRVPAMPNNHTLEQFPNRSLLEVRGRATWKYQPIAKCDLSEWIAIKELTIGVTAATKFTAAGVGFDNWEEPSRRRGSRGLETGNHLAILIPCWAYILSNFLVEIQGCLMEYTDILAPSMDNSINSGDPGYRVFVGNADSKETRWWKAILAPGQGWRSIIRTSSDATYLAPWSLEYHGDLQFFIETSNTMMCADNTASTSPPSSEEALRYLTSYCLLHSLGTQYFAALSAVLTLPLQNLLGRKVQLPKPVMVQRLRKSSVLPDVRKQFLDLPHLMTLSCAVRVLSSALWTVFWEPGIDCNLASAWLSPVLSVIGPLVEAHNYEMLVRVLAHHRPRVGPLWLGATLTGLSRDIPHFLRTLEAPYARPESLASAWLGIPQLFMDTPGIGCYKCDGEYIRRIDRSRLLHDVGLPPYGSTPLSSWQPFGRMPLSVVELDVMVYVECERHEKQYVRWEWFGRDGLDILGAGRTSNNTVIDTVSILLTKSAAAVRSIFAWLTVGGEKRKCEVPDRPLIAGSIPSGVKTSGPTSTSNTVKSTEELLCFQQCPDQRASIAATRSIFAWLTVGGEGWGESERSIYEHPWMAGLVPSDTDESASDGPWEADDRSD